ncbi:phosphatase PAP2 family protein [Pseudomonas sp. dw_358]|uniref:phosphatase PAP2 family protein n=1 Tax=Pseudomonas sp. dw_358 TaxID=2720083 RepID=UPI001BD4CDEC|nr:phosphatase PAP2 family protein [Pseudomonas sp. dw_358]
MNKPALFQARWNIRALVTCNLISIALLCFWIWPVGHALCASFDEWFYRILNQPLATSPAWRIIWAVGSVRPFDLVVGVILLSLLIKGDWVFKAVQVRQAILGFVAILLLMVVIRTLFSKWIDSSNLQHDSISMVMPDAVHLSDFYPHIDKKLQIKDSSNQSFPGDHASVLLIWGLFMTQFLRNKAQGFIVWALVVLFSMPRLVAGAHWGQDDYIGGVLLAVMALGWGFFTPFAAATSEWLLRLTAPLFRVGKHIPLVRCLSVVSA